MNEKKSLPVVIETKNVPVRPSKQHTCALELFVLPQAVALANLKMFHQSHWRVLVKQVLLYAQEEEVEKDAVQQLIHLAESALPVSKTSAY